MLKVTKNTTLAKILALPGTEKILAKHNLPCLFCPLAKTEMDKLKIGEICEMYQIKTEELLKELNSAIKKLDVRRPTNE